MNLFDRVKIKSNGLTGVLVDVGRGNNKDFCVIELDDQDLDDGISLCAPEDIEAIPE